VRDVVLIGDQFGATTGHPFATYANVEAYIAQLAQGAPEGKTILIKGSNSLKMTKLIDFL